MAPHNHPHSAGEGSRKRLAMVLLLTLGFMGVEAAAGWWSGSLALVADAGHMLSDSLAMGLSLGAMWLADRPVSVTRTYGYRRAEILAAFVNALGLTLLAGWIVWEALERLGQPRPVVDRVMLGVALAGLGVNGAALWLLRPVSRHSLNMRAVIWHVMGDALGSLGVLGAWAVIHFTGWAGADPLAGVLIALLIGANGLKILADSTHILLDSAPKTLDMDQVNRFLTGYPQVKQVCDLHIWAINSQDVVMTAHLVVEEHVDRDGFLNTLLTDLHTTFQLDHMTIQLEKTSQQTCHNPW
ncbi:MAG: cation diffusion facilitator family transporter [Deltaproteobacteria bacterium]|nr:cation diffusion facilitator family transporter [Deltaproteobacteria bacterium]